MEPRNLALTKNGVKDIARSRFFNSLLTFQRDSRKEERKKKFFHFSMKEPFQEAEAKAVGKRKEEKRKELKAAKRRRSK